MIESEKSQSVSVESVVPQGSLQGPGLFLYYISDLPAKLHSSIHLFADDAIAYLVIESPEDIYLITGRPRHIGRMGGVENEVPS